MPPGKPLQPVLRMKVDELFLRWLSDPGTQDALREGLRRLQAGDGDPDVITGGDPDSVRADLIGRGDVIARGDVITGAPFAQPASPLDITGCRRASRKTKVLQTRNHEPPLAPPPPPPTAALPPGLAVPAFFFPRGRPGAGPDLDDIIARVERVFAGFESQRAGPRDMGVVAKACGCPLYWKAPLFFAVGGPRTGSVSVHKFLAMWRKMWSTPTLASPS